MNYFHPSFKLLEKLRDGARVIKRYSPPATPCDRVMQDDTIPARMKEELSEYRAGLYPVALLHSIREAQSAMATMSSPQSLETPDGESIGRFLTRLPGLWQEGEARPTNKARARPSVTGVPARIPSKVFGARCCCGSRGIRTPPTRT